MEQAQPAERTSAVESCWLILETQGEDINSPIIPSKILTTNVYNAEEVCHQTSYLNLFFSLTSFAGWGGV